MNSFFKKRKGNAKIWIIAALSPSIILILIIGGIVYIIETPFRILNDIFTPKQIESVKEIKKKMGYSSSELGRIALPLDEKYMSIINSPFGKRIHPITKKPDTMHNGVDFGCPTGSNVYALKNANVVLAGWQSDTDHKLGYGLYVILRHEDLDGKYFISLYGHLSELNVKRGDKVKRGDIIGYSGSTGSSSGPHLHFEIRLNNKAVDPMPYLEEFNSQEEEDLEDTEDTEKKEVLN